MARPINHKLTKDYLSNPDLHLFYWLGYLKADGCINEMINRNSHVLVLNSKDNLHLLKYARFVGRKKLNYYKNGNPPDVKVSGQHLLDCLLPFGIGTRKTYIHYPITYRFSCLQLRFFLIGWLDGDGSIIWQKNRLNPIIQLAGTPHDLSDFLSLSRQLGFTGKPHQEGSGLDWKFRTKEEETKELFRVLAPQQCLYKLPRKWDRAVNLYCPFLI